MGIEIGTWKCGEPKLHFYQFAGGLKKQNAMGIYVRPVLR